MARFVKKREHNPNHVPGTMVFIGRQKTEETTIKTLNYNKLQYNEVQLQHIKEYLKYKSEDSVTWINVTGLHDVEKIQSIGEAFNIHRLTLEDIVNTSQCPRIQDFDDYVFMTLKVLWFDEKEKKIRADQLSILLGKQFVLTFHEQSRGMFEPLRERIRKSKGMVRCYGADYLVFAILHIILDNYLKIIEHIGEEIEALDELILEKEANSVLERLNRYKRELNYFGKAVRPIRDMLRVLTNAEMVDFITPSTIPYLKDTEDTTYQIIESIDTYRDMLTDQLNIYSTNVNSRMNEIMKILTIFSATFIPLTFISSIYGTNFPYIPELTFKYGYFIFWGVSILLVVLMLLFFKRKRWI